MHCIIPTIAEDSLMAKVAGPLYTMLHISSKLRTEALKILIVCQKYGNCPLCTLFVNTIQLARRTSCDVVVLVLIFHYKLCCLLPATTKPPNSLTTFTPASNAIIPTEN